MIVASACLCQGARTSLVIRVSFFRLWSVSGRLRIQVVGRIEKLLNTQTAETHQTMTELPKLTYTKEEAAEIVNIPESSIDWLLRKGDIPRRKIAGRIRFTLEDLRAIVESCKVGPSL